LRLLGWLYGRSQADQLSLLNLTVDQDLLDIEMVGCGFFN
jgi:hypothetical protein